MKCEIIRDLLPNYIDELTSPESKEEIEKHLQECELCERYFKEMNSDMKEEREENHKKELEPFIKIRESTFYKIASSVFATLIIGMILFGIYENNFYPTDAYASDVKEIQYRNVNENASFILVPAEEDSCLYLGYNGGENVVVNGKEAFLTLSVKKEKLKPYDREERVKPGCEFLFLDENTLVISRGALELITYDEDDFIAIRYVDKIKTIKLSDLREGRME